MVFLCARSSDTYLFSSFAPFFIALQGLIQPNGVVRRRGSSRASPSVRGVDRNDTSYSRITTTQLLHVLRTGTYIDPFIVHLSPVSLRTRSRVKFLELDLHRVRPPHSDTCLDTSYRCAADGNQDQGPQRTMRKVRVFTLQSI